MARITQEEKGFLSLAGEFSVCAELLKRNITAHITLGNQKATDLLLLDKDKKSYVIEVKTSNTKRIVTSFFQKYGDKLKKHPDFWVLVQIDDNTKHADFYILTHQEMGDAQMKRNKMSKWEPVTGCDNVLLNDLLEYKKDWNKIVNLLSIDNK